MSKPKSHIHASDIIAIFLCIIMIVYTIFIYKERSFYFIVYYVVMLLFRIFILLLEKVIVRKYDDPLTKFKKERLLCRLTGVLLFVVDLAMVIVLFFGPIFKNYDLFNEYPFLIAVYGAYAVYKIVVAILGFRKARRSFSPFRDIMAALGYIDAMVSLMMFIAMIVQLFVDFNAKTIDYTVPLYTTVLMAIVSLVITIKVIVSRKVPNLLK